MREMDSLDEKISTTMRNESEREEKREHGYESEGEAHRA